MQRGAPLEFVASVVTGVVSLSKTLEDGRIQTVGLLLASDFIGRPERVAIDFDVTATTDVVLHPAVIGHEPLQFAYNVH